MSLKNRKRRTPKTKKIWRKLSSTLWLTWRLWSTKLRLTRNCCNWRYMWERCRKKEFSPVFGEITERFGLLFAGDKIVVPEELKREVVDALHFGHPCSEDASRKQYNLVVRNEEGHRELVQHMHCVHEFRWEFRVPIAVDGKNQTSGFDEPGKEIKWFPGNLHNKHETGEPYNLIGYDRYSKWP